MLKISCKTESGKLKEIMEMHPRAPCLPKNTEPDLTRKSDGQFAGFKDHISNFKPALHRVIRGERTFIEAFETLSPYMRNVLETEFHKYTGL